MLRYLQILFILLFSLNSYAQSIGYQTGTASANLILPLSIETGIGDLDFGEIIVNGTSSRERILPKNGKEFIVKGEASRNITVIFNDVELTNHLWLSNNSGENGKLVFVPDVVLENSQSVESGDNVILKPNGLIGEVKFHVGGIIDVDATQPLGDYEGVFVISVFY